ncbi:MAG: hypothetical protein DWQ10_15945 [Calditrichaeota bacterium]|nr:MAG: hypothetical protein DWQ10_15945 [Calditrichota bacterium]
MGILVSNIQISEFGEIVFIFYKMVGDIIASQISANNGMAILFIFFKLSLLFLEKFNFKAEIRTISPVFFTID